VKDFVCMQNISKQIYHAQVKQDIDDLEKNK